MSSQRESWMTIQKGYIIRHSENDGHAFMRKGAQESDTVIMSVKEAREKGLYKDLIKQFEEYDSEELSEQ
jgi:hypothetical protein